MIETRRLIQTITIYIIHSNTPIQSDRHQDLGVKESTNKVRFITDNRVSRRKKKKTYAEAADSGNSNINEGITYGKNCTILAGIKKDALFCKNASEAASTPTKVCNKPLLNQNVP